MAAKIWQLTSVVLLCVSTALLVALVSLSTHEGAHRLARVVRSIADGVRAFPECGKSGSNPNGNFIDLSQPENPGPFHDLTTDELVKLRAYLESDPEVRAFPMTSRSPPVNSSYIYMADLWLPPKTEVLRFLDQGGPQPDRQARVMLFRGDKSPPVVEERICGPLPNISSCELLRLPNRRSPVEFASRPFNTQELDAIYEYLFPAVERKIGYILRESYNASIYDCTDPRDCLSFMTIPFTSAMTGKLDQRRAWYMGVHQVSYPTVHPVDFALLLQLDGSDPTTWAVDKVWYAGRTFNCLNDLTSEYDFGNLTKTRMEKPIYHDDLFSTTHMRGDPTPVNPQRPPTLVEPDGKRYTLQDRKVEYLGWEFNFRLSPFVGPALFDIRYKGERIAYEFAIQEMGAFYSAHSPVYQSADYVDSGALSGMGTKALVPGADCPETATLVNYTVMNQYKREVGVYDAAFCIFENNNNIPLRRHLHYSKPHAFYNGMSDSALVLRTAITPGNYDYILDFIFHQNGVMETRIASAGFIQATVYNQLEKMYGFQIQDGLLGVLHHHMFNFKADLDIAGTINRYETLDLQREDTHLSMEPSSPYTQTKFVQTLKNTERESIFHKTLDNPAYHLIHNDRVRNTYGEKKAYRLSMTHASKQLRPQELYNEKVVSWARQQIVATKQKDAEFRSSSIFGMYDTLQPVVDFSSFIDDNENIVDEDLVFWLSIGMQHIPSSEDLPQVTTAGKQMSIFLSPFNYFEEDPSMSSRDAVHVSYKDRFNPSLGVKVERNSNSRDQCVVPKVELEEILESNPDQILESRRTNPAIVV